LSEFLYASKSDNYDMDVFYVSFLLEGGNFKETFLILGEDLALSQGKTKETGK